jgi:phosphate/sulfate permease
MDAILNWIVTNPIMTFVIAIIIIALVVYIYLNKKDLLYKAALYAVSVAEDEWGSDMGRIKFAEVYTYIKKEFPLFTLFFPEAKLKKIIEDALVELKKILASKAAKEEEAQKAVTEETTE